MNRRQFHRITEDQQALGHLAREGLEECRLFVSRRSPVGFVWRYEGLPGFLETPSGLLVWPSWHALVSLGPRFPIDAPRVFLAPAGQPGRPYHPNILSKPPYLVCYGRHQPLLLLDALARRLARIIMMHRDAIMTDERNSLNPQACPTVRRLVQDGAVPLTIGRPLPSWCLSLCRDGGAP